MANSITEHKKRNGFLDIIKTIATILIVFHHFQQDVDIRFSSEIFIYGPVYIGRLVELFFIISGFLMTPYISKINDGLSFKSFFVRRYLRLIPIVAISTVFDLIIKCVLCYETFVENPLKILLETVSVALGIHGIISDGISFANNPMWYVSALLWCYVIFYIVFSINKRLSVKNHIVSLLPVFLLILLGCIIVLIYVNCPFFNIYIGRSLVSFFFGVLLGIILSQVSLSNKLFVPLLLLIAILFFIPILHNYILSYWNETILYVIMFCYTPVIALSKTDLIIKLFDHPVWSLMAGISFHAFCFHVSVIDIFRLLLKSDAIKEKMNSNGLSAMIVCLVIVYGFSTLTYFMIEKPLSKKIHGLKIYQ